MSSSLKLSAVSNLELSAINADIVSSTDDFYAKGNSFLIEASYKTNDGYKSVKLELSNLLDVIVKNFIMLSCETRPWVPGNSNGNGTYTITPNTDLSIAVPGNITLSASGTSGIDNAIILKSNDKCIAVENTKDNKIQCCATSALWN